MGVGRLRVLGGVPKGLLAAALLVRALDEWWSSLPAGVVESVHQDLGLSYSQAGWLLGLLSVGGVIGLPIAAVSDHASRRVTATAGAFGLALGLMPYALGRSFVLLALGSLVLGICSDLVIQPIESSIAETAGEHLDRVMARQHLYSFVGDAMGPVLLAIGATTIIGWRGAFGITAIGCAAFAVLTALTPMPAPPTPATAGNAARDAWRIARNPKVLLLGLLDVLMSPLDEPLYGFALAVAVTQGTQPAAAQLWLAAPVLLGGVVGSLLAERDGVTVSLMAFGRAATLVGVVLIAGVRGLWPAVVGMFITWVGMSIIWTVVHTRSLTIIPGRSATVHAVIGVIGVLAAIVPALTGSVADRSSLTSALAVFVVAAVLLAILAPNPNRRQPVDNDHG
jgi:predicted MFS family arabinose efflux permease